jgi:CRP-like cAMP-binding protein
VRLFTHVVYEEVDDLIDKETASVREPELFERIETVYGIDRETFDRLLSQLHAEGIVSESSYKELILNPETLLNTNIHE